MSSSILESTERSWIRVESHERRTSTTHSSNPQNYRAYIIAFKLETQVSTLSPNSVSRALPNLSIKVLPNTLNHLGVGTTMASCILIQKWRLSNMKPYLLVSNIFKIIYRKKFVEMVLQKLLKSIEFKHIINKMK